MKKIFLILVVAIIISGAFAQSPQKMSFQAVVRNSNNLLVTSTTIGMRVSILQGSLTGTAVYIETQTPVTNVNGLATIEIGSGTIVTGTFSGINWGLGPYFIKIETDPSGGSNYSIISTNELLSVPYALYAATAGNSTMNGWSQLGNSGTIDSINFIGTTDSVSLNFRVNNISAGRIDPYLLNTFLGYQSGISNTSGYNNNAIGGFGLQFNTTGYNNSANGVWALQSNTTGYNNTANGILSLQSNTTGVNNTASGGQSLHANTIGYSNTANGYNSLFSNTTGYNNTANGQGSLYSNFTGQNNSANGMDALYMNTIGNNNTANGKSALFNNDFGNNNTANGEGALFSNVGGSQNVANGSAALFSNTQGFQNTADGTNSLFYNSSGYHNTANGFNSLYWNDIGYQNTAIGFHALYNNTTGINNTALGANAFNSGSAFSNSTALGYNALITASNMVQLGDTNITDVKTSGTMTANGYSTAYVQKSSAYTLTAKDDIVGVSLAAVITLPSAIGITGRQYTVKNIATFPVTVTVNTTSGQTIDGLTTKSLNQYKYITVVSNGSDWYIIADN